MAMMSHPGRWPHAGPRWRDAQRGLSTSDAGGPPPDGSGSWPVDDSEWDARDSSRAAALDAILDEFTARWERGEAPSIPEFLSRLDPARAADSVTLIYHAYRLAEAAGLDPDPTAYLEQFPAQAGWLARLFRLNRALDALPPGRFADRASLPEVGDEIGPFLLVRTLGEGGFARVFLAEQSDLDHRLVVVKVSTRITPEPRLLARARHSHIVEVLWHSLIDDGLLQLICMPFLGGATLAAVLADLQRRERRPRSGRDLLGGLDRVSAREYPVADLSRPAREIIARLSYARAVAWLVARLAEALDYAYSRGVLHGDVKPSNILLTADGEPMLLDFNLAVGWGARAGEDLPAETGGTLAYMAPERLRAITQPGTYPPPRVDERHRADLYALGMVLLEALAGRIPDQHEGAPRALARALELSRARGIGALVRSSRVAIEPALQSILGRCLAADPADRYHRAAALAEDLDRWCGDRALAFAREPQWPSRLVRWARRRRRVVIAGALSLAVAATSALALSTSGRASLREHALAKLDFLWNNNESQVFRFPRFGHWRQDDFDTPEEALQRLAYYNVLGHGDWRLSDDFRSLPDSQRRELEIWLLEQALRLGRALGQRPDSPDDWRRGLEVLERVVRLRPLGPLETQCRLLRRQLGLPEPSARAVTAPGADPPPRWMEEYLLGVEAEPLRAEDALIHYRNVLQQCSESFWGHYRAAAVAYRLHDPAAATADLEYCVARRPESSELRNQLAGRLYDLGRFDAALDECNKALTLNPDRAESYRSRVFIRGKLGQNAGLQHDINRFELLTRPLGKAPSWRLRVDWMFFHRRGGGGDGMGPFAVDRETGDLPRRLLTADPEEVDLRTDLAIELYDTGQTTAALAEFDKILEISPDHLRSRYFRGGLLFTMDRKEAEVDLSYLLNHPRFGELLRESDRTLHAFLYSSWLELDRGETDRAIRVALRGLEYARQAGNKTIQGELHRTLARGYAVAARSSPEQLQKSAAHLYLATKYGIKNPYKVLRGEPISDAQRNEIALLMRKLQEDGD
jgi:serine/threonine protein kinase